MIGVEFILWMGVFLLALVPVAFLLGSRKLGGRHKPDGPSCIKGYGPPERGTGRLGDLYIDEHDEECWMKEMDGIQEQWVSKGTLSGLPKKGHTDRHEDHPPHH